jgi:hypothetical protein
MVKWNQILERLERMRRGTCNVRRIRNKQEILDEFTAGM